MPVLLACLLLLAFSPITNVVATNPKVTLGIDHLFTPPYRSLLKGKRIGLITNHTGIDSQMRSSVDLLKAHAKTSEYTLAAFFAPEHGLKGNEHAAENVKDAIDLDGIPIYSLHGTTRRPTAEMLKNIDLLIYDIQDIGSRSYTYATTLYYVMEEAAKRKIPVIVTDRPNPINGIAVDGPMLDADLRSFVGYINVPYCHGMTIGELAQFFNGEYKVGCDLHVIPMQGWHREMTFKDTGLTWIPTSPHIPESDSPLFYPITGLLGELQIVNIGVGYTLPFKVVGAPWLHAELFAEFLNKQQFPGVVFHPFHFKPFFGRFAKENCEGVLIVVTDVHQFRPISTQYLLIGALKSLYPTKFAQGLAASKDRIEMFNKVNGTEVVYNTLLNDKFVIWKLRDLHHEERELFLEVRKKYLMAGY